MDDSKLENGKNFCVKLGTKQLPAIVTSVKYAIVAEEFKKNKVLGELILIDRITNHTSACGVVTEVHLNDGKIHAGKIDGEKRALIKGQSAKVIEFLTGKNGVNSEIVQKIEKGLYEALLHTYIYAPVAPYC